MLGYISRVLTEFHLADLLNTLFCTLVCPILEYGAILCDPPTTFDRNMIGPKENSFVMQPINYKYTLSTWELYTCATFLWLEILAYHRHLINITFLSNIFSSKIDNPDYYLKFLSISLATVYDYLFHFKFPSHLLTTISTLQ